MRENCKILIIGEHPLRRCFEEQYAANNCEVTTIETLGDEDVSHCDEIVLLTSPRAKSKTAEDNRALALLSKMSALLTAEDAKRPVVHLLLQSNHTLRVLQTVDLPDTVINTMDVYPFTLESQWSRIVVAKMPGELPAIDYPTLDREPIVSDSKKTVHLLVSGFSSLAKSLAIHAALVAHYPNYNSNSPDPLRTRITILSKGLEVQKGELITRYRSLFENSYYRTTNIIKNTSSYHEPQYTGKRKDFVDVEWEFVDGDIYNEMVQSEIKKWSTSDNQLLTIAIAHDSEDQNIQDVLALPDEVMKNGVTVLVRVDNSMSMSLLRSSSKYDNVYPFGMNDTGYDVRLPLMRMGKLLNACYWGVIEENNPVIDQCQVDEAWKSLPSFAKRFSNIYNVMTIPTKMRSLGHEQAECESYFALSEREVEEIALVEHNRWSVEELIMGFRPCSDSELKMVEKSIADFLSIKDDEEKLSQWKLRDGQGRPCTMKEVLKEDDTKRAHYDLRDYDDLRVDRNGINVQDYDKKLTRCIPLLACAFVKGGDK
ncbi:MAG: hypothetical protein IKW83_00955 [Muribaculaceae bacterium]|nr:hypothetical protein [Muribaculaceae bacterium]